MFRNDYYQPGTFLESIDDDGEYVQPVRMLMENGRYTPEGNYGLVHPLRLVRDACIKILARGLDKRW